MLKGFPMIPGKEGDKKALFILYKQSFYSL